jgi:hypothetical protein
VRKVKRRAQKSPYIPSPQPEPEIRLPKVRERSPKTPASRERKIKFIMEGDYQNWTNTFSRSTVHWDKGNELLEQEKAFSKKGAWREPTDRCCGNSPGKSHTKLHDYDGLLNSEDYRKQVYLSSQSREYQPPRVRSSISPPQHRIVKKRPQTALKKSQRNKFAEIINISTPF